MPNIRAAVKQLRKDKKRHERVRAAKSRLKSVIKEVRNAVETKDVTAAKQTLSVAIPLIDKAATKKIIHWAKASRLISRLTQHVNKLTA